MREARRGGEEGRRREKGEGGGRGEGGVGRSSTEQNTLK